MSIKRQSGRWPEVAPFLDEQQYAGFAARLRLHEFPVRIPHTRLASQFRLDHKDPFDRLLAAQALLGGVPVVSKDAAFDAFSVNRVW